jgi:hypothetical protein
MSQNNVSKEMIEGAIQNSLHYLEGLEGYTFSDTGKYIWSTSRTFIEAIKLQIGGEIEEVPEIGGYYLNFK